MLFAVKEVVRASGHEPVLARSGAEALGLLEGVDAVVTDFAMPGMDGLALLAAVRERDASLPVILLTAQGSERVAVRAMKAGAYEYVTKPFDIDEMSLVIERALETRGLRIQNRQLAAEKAIGRSFVGDTPPMRRLLEAVGRVAPKDVTVLLRGETGTGKELVARAIHDHSRRRERPLVSVNCGAISAGLVESELFGHERGAFTGALSRKIGRFELADGGTIFLDEIGDLPLDLQVKLLRVLQEGEIERVGGARPIRVNVRVIAATHRDLEVAVQDGRFRADLYYRLNVFPLHVPPLRERREDIPVLVRHFVLKYAARMGKAIEHIPRKSLDALTAYDWPGNVRELANIVERSVIVSQGQTLEVGDWLTARAPAARTLKETEREQILAALEETRWRVSGPAGAAVRLGLKPTTLEARMKKLGITRPRPL
jgi:DNA-binding NtrC family response regulator